MSRTIDTVAAALRSGSVAARPTGLDAYCARMQTSAAASWLMRDAGRMFASFMGHDPRNFCGRVAYGQMLARFVVQS